MKKTGRGSDDGRRGLKVVGQTHAKAVDQPSPMTDPEFAVGRRVVPLEFHVRVQEPVEPAVRSLSCRREYQRNSGRDSRSGHQPATPHHKGACHTA